MEYRAPFRIRRQARAQQAYPARPRVRVDSYSILARRAHPSIARVDEYALALRLIKSRNLAELESAVGEVICRTLTKRNGSRPSASAGSQIIRADFSNCPRVRALALRLNPLIVRAALLAQSCPRGQSISSVLANLRRALTGSTAGAGSGRSLGDALGVVRSVGELATELSQIPASVPPAVAAEVAARRRRRMETRRPWPTRRPGGSSDPSALAFTDDGPEGRGGWQRAGQNLIIYFDCSREGRPA